MKWTTAKTRNSAIMLLMALLLDLQPVFAQAKLDAVLMNDKNKRERMNRKSLREANRYKSDFKDTHLNTDTYQYKTGKEGRKAAKPGKAGALKSKKMKAVKEAEKDKKASKRARKK